MATVETSPKLSKWLALQHATTEVARNWSEDIDLDGEPGTREIYILLAHKVIALAFELSFEWPEHWREEVRLVKEGVSKHGASLHNGYEVLTLHINNGSVAAGCSGLDMLNLCAVLFNPASFEPIAEITEHDHEIAGRVEAEHGLYREATYSDLNLVDDRRYVIENGAIRLPRLKIEIARQKLFRGDFYDDEEIATFSQAELEDGKTRCRAQQAKVLEPIYHELIYISLKDARLAAASLQRGIDAAKIN